MRGRLPMALLAVLGVSSAVLALPTPPAAADDVPTHQSTWSWLLHQMGTGTVVTSDSTIEPDEDYPSSWVGEVSGSVTLEGTDAALQDLRVEAVVVTDRAYSIGVIAPDANGRFSFAWSSPGTKVFRLVDPATGDVLAEHAPSTGLVRSFDVEPGHALAGRSFVYDQALAVITALSLQEWQTADRLVDGLLTLQTSGGPGDGGFITSAAALAPESGVAEYRTGNHGVATYALLRYLRDGQPSAVSRSVASAAAERAVHWLLAQRVDGGALDGLLRGGTGLYSGGGFDPGYQIPWASTEHNVDAWHTLRLAAGVLDDPSLGEAADELEEAILARLWSVDEQRFWQGRSPDGPDLGHALDASSWGAIFLAAAGHQEMAERAQANLAWYAVADAGAQGFAPVPFPSAPVLWVEGTAGVALSQLRVGDAAQAALTVQALAPLGSNGIWPGASRDDAWLSMTSAPAVAAACWVVLVDRALAGHPSIWDLENEE